MRGHPGEGPPEREEPGPTPETGPPTTNITAHRQETGASHPIATGRQCACTAPLVGKGRNLAHSSKYATHAPIPAVGPVPDAATVFVGTLLWSTPADAASTLELVADDDIEGAALSMGL